MTHDRRTPPLGGWVRVGLVLGVVLAVAVPVVIAARGAVGPGIRSLAVAGPLPSALALDDIHHRLVVLDQSGGVSLLDTRSSSLAHVVPPGAWRPAFGMSQGAALAVDPSAGRAVVALSSQSQQSATAPPGAARVIDTVTGRVVATPRVGVGDMAVAIAPATGRAFVANLYEQTVSVLSTRDGRALGTVAVAGQPTTLGVDGPGGVVAVGGNSFGATLDARTGHGRSSQALNSLDVMVVDARRHRALAYSESGQLSALDMRTGALVGQTILGQPGVMAGDDDAATGKIFFAARVWSSTQGRALLVDARTGRPTRTVTLPGVPSAFAADPRTGDMLALLSIIRPRRPDPWGWLPAPIRRLLPFQTPPAGVSVTSTIAVLDGRDGRLKRSIDLPADGAVAVSMALDARAGRLYVARTWAWSLAARNRAPQDGDVLVLDAPA